MIHFTKIEEILQEEGIPRDFLYLAIIEGGLQNVVSPAGATGFWQFMDDTAREFGLEVRVVAVGTGQAIKNSRRCDADVLIAHHRESEDKFVEEGYGVWRKEFMYNDFVLVGPKSDPAGVKKVKSIVGS